MKAYSMRGLKAGWHYGEGVAISEQTVDNTAAFEKLLVGDNYIEMYPMLDGKIKVCVGTDSSEEVEFLIDEKGIVSVSIGEEGL